MLITEDQVEIILLAMGSAKNEGAMSDDMAILCKKILDNFPDLDFYSYLLAPETRNY